MPMNNAIIPILHTLLREQAPLHGKFLLSDLSLLRNLLADYAPQFRTERNLLLRTAEEKIPTEVIAHTKNGDTVDPLLIGRWVKRLEIDHGISRENANWAVIVWVKALGRKTVEMSAILPLVTQIEGSPSNIAPISVLRREQEYLLEVMLDSKQPPQKRAEAGRKINELPGGDPRAGVLNFTIPWCKVSSGEFTFGDDSVSDNGTTRRIVLPYDYWIAPYPVTYAQYAQFVADAGYTENHRDCWTDAGWKWKKSRTAPERYWNDSQWHIPNHPVVGIAWYEAHAFTRWLNKRGLTALLTLVSGYALRLPTEAEWEKAARYPDGRRFPWGNNYVSGYANINEITDRAGCHYLGRTTAVGIYPKQNEIGAFDLSGNVWEWCLSKWVSEYKYPEDNTPEGNPARGLRGGSWSVNRDFTCAPFRYGKQSSNRGNGNGFRVVVAPVFL